MFTGFPGNSRNVGAYGPDSNPLKEDKDALGA